MPPRWKLDGARVLKRQRQQRRCAAIIVEQLRLHPGISSLCAAAARAAHMAAPQAQQCRRLYRPTRASVVLNATQLSLHTHFWAGLHACTPHLRTATRVSSAVRMCGVLPAHIRVSCFMRHLLGVARRPCSQDQTHDPPRNKMRRNRGVGAAWRSWRWAGSARSV